MNITIIGAGIGGLTTALFLERLGISVQLYEQSSEIKPVGAGIVLAHNAMQAYDKLGFHDQITALGNPLSSINITTSKLKPISIINTAPFNDKYLVNHIAIQRGVLQHFLVNQLTKTPIYVNKQVTDIKQDKKVSITFSDNQEIQCDAVIAADGIHSRIRQSIFNDTTLRNAEQQCWRGISDIRLPPKFKQELNELWGRGSRFGFVQIAENKVYWYALHSASPQINKTELTTYFQGYDSIVSSIIFHTPHECIFSHDIFDLQPISTWHDDNICLLGDAAHATTPNLGQGACQAIEDAYVISRCLERYPTSHAFAKYQEIRKKKAHDVVKVSWKLGRLSQLKNPIFSAIRNTLMRMTPERVNIKQSNKLYQLDEINDIE